MPITHSVMLIESETTMSILDEYLEDDLARGGPLAVVMVELRKLFGDDLMTVGDIKDAANEGSR
jgi:hypothetical protein